MQKCNQQPTPQPNSKKIILDLCGGTGSWSAPYHQCGYDVRIITLPENDVRHYEPPPHVYGILAAPPCTYFSFARRNVATTPREFLDGFEIVLACLRIISKCQATQPLAFWCMENPGGHLQYFLGKPAAVFQHWQYGDPGIKTTHLWGYFNHPQPNSLRPPNPTYIEDLAKTAGLTRQAIRSQTPRGFARAFQEANQ